MNGAPFNGALFKGAPFNGAPFKAAPFKAAPFVRHLMVRHLMVRHLMVRHLMVRHSIVRHLMVRPVGHPDRAGGVPGVERERRPGGHGERDIALAVTTQVRRCRNHAGFMLLMVWLFTVPSPLYVVSKGGIHTV